MSALPVPLNGDILQNSSTISQADAGTESRSTEFHRGNRAFCPLMATFTYFSPQPLPHPRQPLISAPSLHSFYFENIMWMELCGISSLRTDFFYSGWFPGNSSYLLHVLVAFSFLLLYHIPCYGQTTVCLAMNTLDRYRERRYHMISLIGGI